MNDLINAIFELGGGLLITLNCIQLRKDKQVKGVSIPVVAFFSVWGFWNIYYYPSLGQTLSFIGGIIIALANTTWVIMAIYYARKK
jgi:uncharacterized membrane protein YfcA